MQAQHASVFAFICQIALAHRGRKSELRLAKWTCIDLQKGELFVAVSKSGRSRTVVLSKKALAVLEQVKLRSEALGLPITRDSWVFANPRTGQPYTSLHIAFFKARDSAGLSSVRMHDLRHTYARLFPNTLQDRVNIVAESLNFDRI